MRLQGAELYPLHSTLDVRRWAFGVFSPTPNERISERNFVVVRRRRGRRFRWWRGPAAATRAAFVVSTASSTAAARTTAEKLQAFTNDLELAPFLPGLLIVPGVE